MHIQLHRPNWKLSFACIPKFWTQLSLEFHLQSAAKYQKRSLYGSNSQITKTEIQEFEKCSG